MFTERKITAFQNRISDLLDTPTLTAAELKARFDSCPEELREALNGVCDDGKVLEDRMDAYRAQTFTGEITRDMLSVAIQEELDDKAEQAMLDTEAAAREGGDAALDTRVTATEAALLQKCEFITGTYLGNWSGNLNDPWTQTIKLGFQPKVLLVASATTNGNSYSIPAIHLALPDVPSSWITITATGFTAGKYMNWGANGTYRYIAFK